MDNRDFEAFLNQNPAVHGSLARSLGRRPTRSFGPMADIATLVLLFPVVRFVIMQIGLPWLHTARRYSEVQRQRVERWIDQQAIDQGLDPDQVETQSKALMQELESTTDAGARQQWQHLKDLLGKE